MNSKRALSLLSLAGLAVALVAPLRPASTAAEDPIVALHRVSVIGEVDAKALANCKEALIAFSKARPGLGYTDVVADTVTGQEVLVVQHWASLAAAEDGGLALDGSELEKALAGLGEPQPARFFRALRLQNYDRGTAGYTEVVVFRTKPGTTRDDHLALFDAAEAGFSKEEGVRGHALGLSPDGHWVHHVGWKSAEDFARASKALMRDAGVRSWITSLDFGRFVQRHGAPE